jgi:hypothetical protein
MAKVTGPLFSLSASGKIANAMVFFGWKGINVVREWLIPTNKQSGPQGDQRCILGGTGRAVGLIRPNPGSTIVSAFAQQLIDLGLIPAGQTKQSYLVKYILDTYLNTTANYTANLAAFTAALTAYTAFNAGAVTMSVVDFSLGYQDIPTYDKGFGLYLIAKAAKALSFVGTPYTIDPTTWVLANVSAMLSDFTKA